MSPSPEQLPTDASREQGRSAVDATFAAYDDHPLDEPDEWGDLASWRAAAGSS